MFRILFSAFNSALGFVFRSIIVKFAVFFGLFFVVTEFIPILIEVISKYFLNVNIFNQLPDGVIYFLNVFQFPSGASLCLSAYLTRFVIRRIPVLG